MKRFLLLGFLFAATTLSAQNNILSTDSMAEQVMLGHYNPAQYTASTVLNHPDTISRGILARISPDSLKQTILQLAAFHNRNTGSDTASPTIGIGAARRWVYQRFAQFSAQNENRLIPSYLQFDMGICNMPQHRDIFAVLPGLDTTDKRIIIIEGHIDSRCEDLCDSLCQAEGIEDNASGTALVIELARVMSKYSYNQTIVFLVVIGEEQGLFGSEAFADYVQQKGITVKAVQNNDVIGGIICGQTSSPPSCPGLNEIDSTGVRIFSAGGFNSKHKQYARFCKLEYKEELRPFVTVPMDIRIMSPEDRTGRSGDHVPFRAHGYTSIRYTSANEHGDANVADTNYTDRQHSYRDSLGVDTDGDQIIDSFFVDFRYLARNAVINGNAAGMAAIGPKSPDLTLAGVWSGYIGVQITQQTQYALYRIAVRTTTTDWDSVYTTTQLLDTIYPPAAGSYFVSVASVDTNGIESLFSREVTSGPIGINEISASHNGITLLPNKPNPFDEATIIGVDVSKTISYKSAYIRVVDLQGREVQRLPLRLDQGINEVLFTHGYGATGTYTYSLIVDGKLFASRKMIFAN